MNAWLWMAVGAALGGSFGLFLIFALIGWGWNYLDDD